jgi:hypothetical protein
MVLSTWAQVIPLRFVTRVMVCGTRLIIALNNDLYQVATDGSGLRKLRSNQQLLLNQCSLHRRSWQSLDG